MQKSVREREELHSKIWKIADDLRGSVDGWDFKNYVLGMMFYRFISENLCQYVNAQESGDFDFAKLKNSEVPQEAIEAIVAEKGFYIAPEHLFQNVLARNEKTFEPDLNTRLHAIFSEIEGSTKGCASERAFQGLFADFDTNSPKLGSSTEKKCKRLFELLHGVADMGVGDLKTMDIDAFGDAYEFLMAMYASSAGKSGGEYYTPQEVSELLTRLTLVGRSEVNRVYDPACGSGSLLLKFAKILGTDKVRQGFYGQELNITTYNLCRINMFLHDVGYEKFSIANDDTLLHPFHWDEQPFDCIVSNPPYSVKWVGEDNPTLINDPRFAPAGVLAPKSKADLAFVMHSLSWLDPKGSAAIVCFPGIFYRGGKEQKIRQYLVENNFVDAVIQLPDNLFYGTSIATCILVLKKGKKTKDVVFVDGSEEFVKVTNSNKLTEENIANLLKLYEERQDVEYKAKVVSLDEIAEKDFVLSVSTYVEKEDKREKIDIKALNAELERIEKRQAELRSKLKDLIAEIEGA